MKIKSDTHLHPAPNADSNPSGIRILKSTDPRQTSQVIGFWRTGGRITKKWGKKK